MSYSFSVTAKSRDGAISKAEAEFNKVVEAQPMHKADKDAAMNALAAMVDVLVEPEGEQLVVVSVSGSLAWRKDNEYISANVNVSAHIK